MKVSVKLIEKQIACCLAILLALPCGEAFAAAPQQAAAAGQAQSASSAESSSLAAGATAADADAGSTLAEASPPLANLPDAPSPANQQSAAQNGQSGTSQSTADQQQNGAEKPLGTAAAPYEKPEGIAASRPAGAVIAPAKQRRVRAIFISIAVVAAAGIAVGTVVALSHASPSRPQ
ncbi:MAG: hypothetical protein WBE76_15380 [Terracidiphilus sp.]